ncbi:unnamed protein product [Toxocara canis]|uniref:Protein RRP5-like protein n=1 Tax=Toxocara canis TaxID=6265 RepID=A0A183UAQ0_TOXCA|nr:unnamed protein product [Toxocara canis]
MPDLEIDFPREGAEQPGERKREPSESRIRKIHDDSVMLESADGVLVTLPATNISDQLTTPLESSSFTLMDIFAVGQMIAYKVIKTANLTASKGKEKYGSRRPLVSCSPSVVNAHLVPSGLLNGLVVNGSIESIEDKGKQWNLVNFSDRHHLGAVINLGLRSSELRGFLPSAALPQHLSLETLIRGQVLLVRIHNSSSSGKVGRVINVSAVPEMESLDGSALEKLRLNMLMPGTILPVEPLHSTPKGVFVELGNGVKGFIRKQHLPPRLRKDPSKLVKTIRVVVMFCQQNSQMLVLCAHPDIVALSKPQKRSTFEGVSIGDKVLCEVSEVDRYGNVCFDLLVDDSPKGSLVSAFATRANLHTSNEESVYKCGSVHQARVLSYKMIERQLIVSTKKEVLAQKMVSLMDAVPGEKVRAKVESVKSNGLCVFIYDRLSAFIPNTHVSDKNFAHLHKHFSKGQALDCRILEADAQKHRLILTSKPSLLNTKYVIVRKYCADDVGAVTLGYVRAKHPSGGLIIGFYGGVRAFMFPKEAARLGDINVGCTVQVKVQSVDVEKEQMLVAVADPSFISGTTIIRSNAFAQGKGAAVSYAATIRGTSDVIGDVKQRQRLDIDVHLGKKWGGTLQTSITVQLLSDALDPLVDTLTDCFKIGSKICRVTVLGESAGLTKVTGKRFLIDWLETHPRIGSFDDLSKGLLVCGTVTQLHNEMGHFVELAGGSALVAPARFIADSNDQDDVSEQLQVGQTVIARVSSLDFERKRFSLILNQDECLQPSLCHEVDEDGEWCSMGLRLVEYMIADWDWCVANLQSGKHLPSLGNQISVTVVQPLNDAVLVEWGECDLKGFARKGNFPARKYRKGETLMALLLDAALPSCELEVFIIDVIEKGAPQSKKAKKAHAKLKRVEVGAEVEVCVAVVKRDFIAVVTVGDDIDKTVIYLPSRFHPNVVTPCSPIGRFERGAVFKATVMQVCGSTLIGLAEGDLAYARALLTAKRRAKQKKSAIESPRKKVKPFMIYPAKVIGVWNRGKESACAVELELPGSTLGRLHGSELDDALLEKERYPVAAFLHDKAGKTVNVKVISIGAVMEATSEKIDLSKPTKRKPVDEEKNFVSCVRVAECTMRSWKMVEGKKKQSLLGYQQNYMQGEMVTVFVRRPVVGGTLQVEASPVSGGFIQKQNLGDSNLMVNPAGMESPLVDRPFEPGEALKARVIGISAARRHCRGSDQRKTLEFSLTGCDKEIKSDERVVGRVVSTTQSPSSVVFALTNGQRAVITPTGISSHYVQALDHMKAFQPNEVYFIYLLRLDEEAGRWLAVTESRYKNWGSKSTKQADNMLIRSAADIEQNSLLKGFVSSVSNGHAYVEVAPGIMGRIEQRKSTMSLKPDQLITVRILRVSTEGGLRLLYMGAVTVHQKTSSSEDPEGRKRMLSTTSSGPEGGVVSARKKSRMAGFSGAESERELVNVKPVQVEAIDPGLDWSLSGFTPADLAAIAHIGENERRTSGAGTAGENASKEAKLAEEREETIGENVEETEKRSKPRNKKEREMMKEKELSERELKLIKADNLPESQSDFDRLLTGNPNSSQLWIRYMSFFVSEKDIEKARATAERALSVISYREDDEIYNVWTAYLNLELSFGTPESLKAVFERAINSADTLKVYKQMVRIYQNAHKDEEAGTLLEEMLKKFRHEDLDIWFIYGQHLMQSKRFESARKLLQRATKSLPEKHHVAVISRFAQMEYKFGDSEQGKTLFESILSAYPRKADIWSVYIDMLVKSDKISEARQVLERVTSMNLATHKRRTFFKKWIDIEQKHGSEEQQKLVRERALHFIEDITEKMDL